MAQQALGQSDCSITFLTMLSFEKAAIFNEGNISFFQPC